MNRVHLVSGNRIYYKQASKLGHFLFDFGDSKIRNHWEDKPFRKLYRRRCIGLNAQYNEYQLGACFKRLVFSKLYTYH
jgi:hypothetical protein